MERVYWENRPERSKVGESVAIVRINACQSSFSHHVHFMFGMMIFASTIGTIRIRYTLIFIRRKNGCAHAWTHTFSIWLTRSLTRFASLARLVNRCRWVRATMICDMFFVRWCHLFSFLQCKIFMPTDQWHSVPGFSWTGEFFECLHAFEFVCTVHACIWCVYCVRYVVFNNLHIAAPLPLSSPIGHYRLVSPHLGTYLFHFHSYILNFYFSQLMSADSISTSECVCERARGNDGGTASNIWIKRPKICIAENLFLAYGSMSKKWAQNARSLQVFKWYRQLAVCAH